MGPRPRNSNRRPQPTPQIDFSALPVKSNKKLRPNPRSKKPSSNSSRPLAQRLDAMRTTNWRTGSPFTLNPRLQGWAPRKYIITTPDGTTSSTIPSIVNIPGYNPEFTFKASPPLSPNIPEGSSTLRGGQEAIDDGNHDFFQGRRFVNYMDIESLAPPLRSAARLPASPSSLPACLPSPDRKAPRKLPITDLMRPLYPARKRKLAEMEYEYRPEEAISGAIPPSGWVIVDNKLVLKKSIGENTLLMKEDETIIQYLERARKTHSIAPLGEKYRIRRQTLNGINPFLRRMRVHTSLAEASHMTAPGFLSETTTWANIVSAVHSVLRQEAIEALWVQIGALRRNCNESIKHWFEHIKMLEEEVRRCEDEVLYEYLVKRSLGGLDDRGVQLRVQSWLRIDGLIDEGGELVRNVKVDDIRDAVFASSKLIGAANEFVLLDEFQKQGDQRCSHNDGIHEEGVQ